MNSILFPQKLHPYSKQSVNMRLLMVPQAWWYYWLAIQYKQIARHACIIEVFSRFVHFLIYDLVILVYNACASLRVITSRVSWPEACLFPQIQTRGNLMTTFGDHAKTASPSSSSAANLIRCTVDNDRLPCRIPWNLHLGSSSHQAVPGLLSFWIWLIDQPWCMPKRPIITQ